MDRWIKRLIAVLEIGGGFMGITIMLLSHRWNMNVPVHVWILFVWFTFLFLFGIVSGLALLEKPQLGSALSAVYQAFQIPIVSSPLVTYELLSGLQLGFGWLYGRPAVVFEFGARSTLVFWKHTDQWLIGINMLALFFLVYLLFQLRPKVKATEPSSTNINSPQGDKEVGRVELKESQP